MIAQTYTKSGTQQKAHGLLYGYQQVGLTDLI
jgi:hypothetical protein